jgi:hypothetical protein
MEEMHDMNDFLDFLGPKIRIEFLYQRMVINGNCWF